MTRSVRPRHRSALLLVPLALFLLFLSSLSSAPAYAQGSLEEAESHTYTNPILPDIPGQTGVVESCADPSIIRGQPGDDAWYAYCTTDPLNDEDQTGGTYNFHLVPVLRSTDLVNWLYMGDAFTARPSWADPTAGIWAPDIEYFNGQYYLYYGVTDVRPEVSGEPEDCHFDNAIGVATSSSPLGPWTYHSAPVIEPRRGGGGCNFFWTYDPDVITTPGGERYIYYGSYYGGIEVRPLSADGLTTVPAQAAPVAIGNRYEGAEVHLRDGWYYLFVSASNCCNGPTTGYSVFAGRSQSPMGPFVDKEGVSFLAGRVGGTPVISMNGNRWVGPGHNDVFTDFAGQTWTVYHAINRFEPYFAGAPGFNKRPLMLDPIVWVDGWPMVRGGLWASDQEMPGPAAQPGMPNEYVPELYAMPQPGPLVPELSDEFAGPLGSQWSWVREPAAGSYGVENGYFRFDTQAADLYEDNNSASVLRAQIPADLLPDDYMIETRVRLNLPPEGCCFNYVQAGLVLYGDDNNYLKLVHASIWETRQTEWAKESFPAGPGNPRYGNTLVGPPGEWTGLRIFKQQVGDEQEYTAFTQRDNGEWVHGGTWTHTFGAEGAPVYLGLVSMGGSGFIAEFDYVRVYGEAPPGPTATPTATVTATTVPPTVTATATTVPPTVTATIPPTSIELGDFAGGSRSPYAGWLFSLAGLSLIAAGILVRRRR